MVTVAVSSVWTPDKGVQPVNVTGVVPGTTVPVGQIGLCLPEQSIAVPLPPGVMPQVDDSMLTAEPVVMS
jgi:hypothetical protein